MTWSELGMFAGMMAACLLVRVLVPWVSSQRTIRAMRAQGAETRAAMQAQTQATLARMDHRAKGGDRP